MPDRSTASSRLVTPRIGRLIAIIAFVSAGAYLALARDDASPPATYGLQDTSGAAPQADSRPRHAGALPETRPAGLPGSAVIRSLENVAPGPSLSQEAAPDHDKSSPVLIIEDAVTVFALGASSDHGSASGPPPEGAIPVLADAALPQPPMAPLAAAPPPSASPARPAPPPATATLRPPPPPPTAEPPPPAPVALSPLEQQLFDGQNAERAKAALSPLRLDAGVQGVARRRAADMAANGYFSHTSPTGETAFTLLAAAGINAPYAAENIGYNTFPDGQSATGVLAGFMGSLSHRANILNARHTRVGVAMAVGANGMKYYAVVFVGP